MLNNKYSSLYKAHEKIYTELSKVKIKQSVLFGEVYIKYQESNSIFIDKLKMKLRNNSKDISYYFDIQILKSNKNKILITFEIDLESIVLEPFYWDLFIGVIEGKEKYFIKIKNPALGVIWNLEKKISKYEYNNTNGFVVYPYITKGNALAINYREKTKYENRKYRIKERLAYFYYLIFKLYLDRKDIWIGYEKFSETAQDNAYYFFDYCYKNSMHKNYYYVIKEKSKDFEKLKDKNNRILIHMSFKYMVYIYAAKLLISSESKGHCYDLRIQKGNIKKALDKKRIVFLQHGVIGFKKIDFFSKKKNPMNLFVASSEVEKKILKKYFNYNDEEIIVTGLCRWDFIKDKSCNENREILIMPTWRSWMDGLSEEKFVESEYFLKYCELLTTDKLTKLIDKYNVKINFFLHPKFKKYIDKFDNIDSKINIYRFGDVNLNEILMKSSLLVTDYSSIAWDMYYQKKPVIFYQFDLESYNKYQGSYSEIDIKEIGDQDFEVDSLILNINKYINNNYKEEYIYGKNRNKYFKYIDNNNCTRTYNNIIMKRKAIKRNKYHYIYVLRQNLYMKYIWNKLKRNTMIKKILNEYI